MVYPISKKTLFPAVRFFVKKTTGIEQLPKGAFVMACKHIGPLDAFFIYAAVVPKINRKIHFIANNLKWGWLWEKMLAEGWAGTIPYYRDNPGLTLQLADIELKKGEIVGIFPEGILQDYDKQRRRAKTGAARLAIWNHVPVVPVGLVHDVSVRPDLPKLQRRRQVIRNILLNPHALEIHIGPPCALDRFSDRPMTKELLDEAMDLIMDRIDERTHITHKQ